MMVLKVTDLFLTFVIVALMPQMGYSCRCSRFRNMQNEVCAAEFVFFGTVDSYDEDSNRFHLTVTKNFKGKFQKGSTAKIGTLFGTSCGIELEKGMHYLMVGGGNSVSICHGRVVEIKYLSYQQLFYLVQCPRRNQYLRNCACKVVAKGGIMSSDSCVLHDDCLDKKAICLRRRGQCMWSPQVCPE